MKGDPNVTAKHTRPPAKAVWSDFCAVTASPELQERLKAQLETSRRGTRGVAPLLGLAREPRWPGFNDGVIFPPGDYPVGTSARTIREGAAARAPLRGSVRVIVVLVDYSDKAMAQTAAHFNDLFFSTGVLPTGSVKEYYAEVTGGLVDIVGEVKGPYRLPQTLAWYANGNFGIGRPSGTPRANIMAQDAAVGADPNVNFGPYDNDGNGYVDAFVVIHAGTGGEQSGNSGDIWSHKWTLPAVYTADSTKIFAYLTVPEDSRIGVCAHELGHLLFGFPDLYDTDYTSEGIGNWCLMAGGSWNGGGDTPAHASAWCKANQGWAGVTNVTTNGTISIPDVKLSRNVHRVWTNGASGSEYFLLENRQRSGFDSQLPGDGLLIWHIDESQPGNTDENHYKVGLVQADGKRDLEMDRNRGDNGDPYPGASNNAALSSSSTPNSNSYAGANTNVSVTSISPPGATMTATVAVTAKSVTKDTKDAKDAKERKEALKDFKEPFKERKDAKERKEALKDFKEPFKERKDTLDAPGMTLGFEGGGVGGGQEYGQPGLDPSVDLMAALDARVRALEEMLGAGAVAEPFISGELRPELTGGPTYGSSGASLQQRMAAGDREAKLEYDTAPPR